MGFYEAITCFILGWSVYNLTKTLKELTGKKPNTCLMVWHIINILISSGIYIFVVIFSEKMEKISKERGFEEDWCKKKAYEKAHGTWIIFRIL